MSDTYSAAREALLVGGVDLDDGEISAALVRGYTFSDAHVFLADATGAGAELVDTAVLTGKTFTAGTFTANNVLYVEVPEGADITSVLVWQSSDENGSPVAPSAQRLIVHINGGDLPVTPNGRDIELRFSPVDGIFVLQ